MGLPPQLVDAPNQQRGGQIFFRPGDDDGHLYLAAGHGGGAESEASSPFLGKIIRLHVDRMPDNEPKIFASGLSDSRGCSQWRSQVSRNLGSGPPLLCADF